MQRIAHGKRRAARTGSIAAVLVSVALLTGACGGDDEPKKTVAAVTTTPSAAGSAAPQGGTGDGDKLAYAKCMRENGLPDFPDPLPGGGLGLPEGLDPQSAEFKKAESSCKQFLPKGPPQDLTKGGQDDQWPKEQKLAYAKCMRDNGLPKFPDPDKDGGFVFMKDSGIDPGSEAFRKAEQACNKYQPKEMQGQTPQQPAGAGA